jgi:type I restriction enzyme S subunit
LLEQYKKGVMQQLFSGKLRFKDENGKDYADWEERKLGEVGKIITGSTPPTSNFEYYNGNQLFVSPADINGARYVLNTKTTLTDLGFEKGRKLIKGTVLFVCIGSTIGKVAIAGFDCITNQQINAIEANSFNSNDFIFSLLELNAINIKLLAGVQAVPQINKTAFSNFKFMFPSLPEQQKIAAFLSSIDAKIESTNQQINQTQSFKKGLLQQLFV